MNRIESIIKKDKSEIKKSLKELKRPYFRLDWKTEFKPALLSKCDMVLTKKHGRPMKFKLHDNIKTPMLQLWYYTKGSKHFKGDLSKGILAYGLHGCGKSTLMIAYCQLINDLLLSRSMSKIQYNERKIYQMHSLELADKLSKVGFSVVNYKNIALYIDDINKEPLFVKNMGTDISPIPDVMALRAVYGSWTLGTANYGPDSMTKRYGETTGERFIELFNFMLINGGSKRKLDKIEFEEK